MNRSGEVRFIRDNLEMCMERINRTAAKSGRNPSDITLVAVTKMVEVARINKAIEAGITHIGENKVQEARSKYGKISPVNWHMIGHLQTNKVKYAVSIFDMIQSVDSLHLAQEIEKRCAGEQKVMPVLVEVNTSGEKSKYGCDPDSAPDLVSQLSIFNHIRVQGLMTIGLFSDDMKLVRPCFIRLRELSEKIGALNLPSVEMHILSMGMSSDFEVAVEEGSTMVRIGTAIFGPRNHDN
jgi:pyridoxal phosphate enzyme (YggS family)